MYRIVRNQKGNPKLRRFPGRNQKKENALFAGGSEAEAVVCMNCSVLSLLAFMFYRMEISSNIILALPRSFDSGSEEVEVSDKLELELELETLHVLLPSVSYDVP